MVNFLSAWPGPGAQVIWSSMILDVSVKVVFIFFLDEI